MRVELWIFVSDPDSTEISVDIEMTILKVYNILLLGPRNEKEYNFIQMKRIFMFEVKSCNFTC